MERCRSCGEPVDAQTVARCEVCGGAFHLAPHLGYPSGECGYVMPRPGPIGC